MNSTIFPPIPTETAKAARAVFGGSNFYLVTGDQANHLFAGLIQGNPGNGVRKPVQRIAMLYLVTIFQYIETLPDLLATDALRERVDWKYALHLPLNYPGLETAASFCEFRKWLLANPAGGQDFQELIDRLNAVMEVSGNQPIRMETDQILLEVCTFSRLTKIWETINQALETLAAIRPDWLLITSQPHWYEFYDQRRRNLNLRMDPVEQEAFALAIGSDIDYLLNAILDAGLPVLADLPEIQALKQVYREQFAREEGTLLWRKDACAGCSIAAGNKVYT